MTAITDKVMMAGVQAIAASGKNVSEKRRKPYAPILMRIPARMMLPAVGASTCASGSQVWTGNIGTLTAKAVKNAAKAQSWNVWLNWWFMIWSTSNVLPAAKYTAMIAISISTLPTSVYRKNLIA